MAKQKFIQRTYNLVIIFCFLSAIGFLIIPKIQEPNSSSEILEEFSSSDVNSNNQNDISTWLFELRMDNYTKNLNSLKNCLLNIVLIITLGILLIFYRPKGIEVSFIKLKIPEGLLYFIVIFGTLYTISNFGLEFNSAIDSRLSLHDNLISIIGSDQYQNLPYDQKPSHNLVDNALLDTWFGYFFNIFINEGLETNEFFLKVFTFVALFGIYGTFFGVLFAVSFATAIVFGSEKSGVNTFSNIFLIFAILSLLLGNIVWVAKHNYSSVFVAYCWLVAGISIIFWKAKGMLLAERLRPKKVKSDNNK